MQFPNTLKTASFLQKLQWIADPVEYMEKAVQQHPDLFTAEIVGFGGDVVFVNHPQGIQEIFTNDRNKFAAIGELSKVLQPLIGDYSVLLLNGNHHKRQRQLIMPSFHAERLGVYGQAILNLTEEACNQLPFDKPILAHDLMLKISMEVVLKVVFGLSEGERYQKLKDLVPKFVSEMFNSPLKSSFLFFSFLQQDLGSWSPWGRFIRQRQKIDELLYTEIAERRRENNPERIDILSLLISAKDEEGKSMTDQELRDELITLLIAGHETTATAMAWGLYWIHHSPKVCEKLLQELDTIEGLKDPMSIFKLPYLAAVCNETLRISPVVMFTLPRAVQEPIKLLGHQLEAGTIVQGCIYLTHQREDLYPQPKQFKPERFLERHFTPYEFMPFGGGVRRCIGEALAQFEMKLVLATILSSFQLSLDGQRPERLQRRGVVLGPADGVKILVKGRRARQESLVVAANTLTC